MLILILCIIILIIGILFTIKDDMSAIGIIGTGVGSIGVVRIDDKNAIIYYQSTKTMIERVMDSDNPSFEEVIDAVNYATQKNNEIMLNRQWKDFKLFNISLIKNSNQMITAKE